MPLSSDQHNHDHNIVRGKHDDHGQHLLVVFLFLVIIFVGGIASLIYQYNRLRRALRSNDEKIRLKQQEYASTVVQNYSQQQLRSNNTLKKHAELVKDIHTMARMQTQVTQKLVALKQVMSTINDRAAPADQSLDSEEQGGRAARDAQTITITSTGTTAVHNKAD